MSPDREPQLTAPERWTPITTESAGAFGAKVEQIKADLEVATEQLNDARGRLTKAMDLTLKLATALAASPEDEKLLSLQSRVEQAAEVANEKFQDAERRFQEANKQYQQAFTQLTGRGRVEDGPIDERIVSVTPPEKLQPLFDTRLEGMDDPLVGDAMKAISARGRASAVVLQRALGVGYARGLRILDELTDAGLLGSNMPGGTREILFNKKPVEDGPITEDASLDPLKSSAASLADMSKLGGEELNPKFWQGVEAIRSRGRASPVVLQRALGVGYAEGLRIIEQMTKVGLLGPDTPSGAREILFYRGDL